MPCIDVWQVMHSAVQDVGIVQLGRYIAQSNIQGKCSPFMVAFSVKKVLSGLNQVTFTCHSLFFKKWFKNSVWYVQIINVLKGRNAGWLIHLQLKTFAWSTVCWLAKACVTKWPEFETYYSALSLGSVKKDRLYAGPFWRFRERAHCSCNHSLWCSQYFFCVWQH